MSIRNQMIHKQMNNAVLALAGLHTGHTVLVGGFGSAGLPTTLINAVLETDAWDLTIVSNNAGYDREGVAILIEEGRVKKLICSYPLTAGATAFRRAYAEGKVELELVPQGTLVERIRCAGAGLGGFLSPISVGTPLAEGKPVQTWNGRQYVLEFPLHADFALVRARFADRIGNLSYHLSGMNFNPVMAMAAHVVVAEVDEILALGDIDPERVGTPSIFVDRLVLASTPQVA
jgi:3-oxoadipate CoA-transferase alpha subunit